MSKALCRQDGNQLLGVDLLSRRSKIRRAACFPRVVSAGMGHRGMNDGREMEMGMEQWAGDEPKKHNLLHRVLCLSRYVRLKSSLALVGGFLDALAKGLLFWRAYSIGIGVHKLNVNDFCITLTLLCFLASTMTRSRGHCRSTAGTKIYLEK